MPKSKYAEEVLYRKVGRRYEPTHEFFRNPVEGVWIVQKKEFSTSQRFIARLGELPDYVPLINLEMRRNEVAQAVVDEEKQHHSADSIVTAVFKVLAKDWPDA